MAVSIIEQPNGSYRMVDGERTYALHLSGGLVVRVRADRKAKYGRDWRELPRGGPAFMAAVALWEANLGKEA